MRAGFIGSAQFSQFALDVLFENPAIDIAGVVTRETSGGNDDFVCLTPFADKQGVDSLNADGVDDDSLVEWMAGKSADIWFCLGWNRLLPTSILNLSPHGVIGYHPTLLPKNRGRHPIIWALVLGLTETGSTFFKMDAGADSGHIVSQRRVTISPDDDAGSLYHKLCGVAREQLDEITKALVSDTLITIPQDDAKATSWRKRSRRDGEIDWRMPAQSIHNLVRALTPPYGGATCTVSGEQHRIWRTRVVNSSLRDVEPGMVLALDGREITVQTGEGSIILVDHEIPLPPTSGDYL